jgi:CIC family chloride channel protein
MLASILAYALNGLIVGWEPLFKISKSITYPAPVEYLWYALLGVAAALVATLLPVIFYGLRDGFLRLPVKGFLRPTIGGLAMGLLAVAVPQVIGGGYGWIQEAIDGRLVIGTLAVLVFAKMFAMGFTVSSGGSGGVFAPSLFVGTMLGALFAKLFHQPSAAFAVVGMAAVFAGAAHVPLATLMMVTEMTGGYKLLVPAALAVTLSYLVQMRISRALPYRSLYESQVPSRADSPAHHSEHLRIALRILKERQVPLPPDVGHLDVLSFLRLGIPVELYEGRYLAIGVLRAKSPYVDRPVGLDGGGLPENTDIIAIIRGERMMAARPDTVLKAGDRLILLTTQPGLDALKKHLDKW